MLIEFDSTCANFGCKRAGAIGCAAHSEPIEKPVEQPAPAKPSYPVWLIYTEAAVFFVAIVMCYLCIVTWGSV